MGAGWVVVVNVIGWLVVQLGLAWAFTRMPVTWFGGGKTFWWENGGRVYDRVFRIRRWKRHLPDGARWFRGGYAKSRLPGYEPWQLGRFCRETWRGELCHWAALACTPVFFLWNPWWGDLIVGAYALGANVPCILVQRYNRARLQCWLEHRTACHCRD